jgi:hypothetical protein
MKSIKEIMKNIIFIQEIRRRKMDKYKFLALFLVSVLVLILGAAFAESYFIEEGAKNNVIKTPLNAHIALSIEDNRIKAIKTLPAVLGSVEPDDGILTFMIDAPLYDGDIIPLIIKSETGTTYNLKLQIQSDSDIDQVVIKKKATTKRIKNIEYYKNDAKKILANMLNNHFENIGGRALELQEFQLFGFEKSTDKITKFETENFVIFKCKRLKSNFDPLAFRIKNTILIAALKNEALIFQLKQDAL